jgi:hypothetical protein
LARPLKDEEYTIQLGEVEIFGMPVDYEEYCKMNGISNIKKRPG